MRSVECLLCIYAYLLLETLQLHVGPHKRTHKTPIIRTKPANLQMDPHRPVQGPVRRMCEIRRAIYVFMHNA